MPYSSQFGQDALVGDVLFKGRSGVFVDVGARDGEVISNTIYLERERGWTGLAIEPHPDLFDRLTQTRRCQCVNVAVSDRDEDAVEFVKYLEEPLGNSGLLSSFRERDRLTAIRHEIIPVPSRPLSSLLGEIDLIHYLDIDVEGHELAVLRGLDFSRVEIRVIGVEVTEGTQDQQAIDALLRGQGFQPFLQLVADRFYAQGPDILSVGRLQALR